MKTRLGIKRLWVVLAASASLSIVVNLPTVSYANAANTPPVHVDGRNLVKPDGNRFMIRGVTYQPVKSDMKDSDTGLFIVKSKQDPIADANFAQISKQIPIWQSANINAIRVYQVDPDTSHKHVMQALASAGIYVLVGIDVATNRQNPQYTLPMNHLMRKTVNAFINPATRKFYPNLLGFSVANEVVDPKANYQQPADIMRVYNDALVVKAVVRDTKAYIQRLASSGKADRKVPVGIASQDTPTTSLIKVGTDQTTAYYASGSPGERADFIGYNTYRWPANNPAGGRGAYTTLRNMFANYPVPVILTEFGDYVDAKPRTWQQVSYLFGAASNVFSGGFAYQYVSTKSNSINGSDAVDPRAAIFNTLPTQASSSANAEFRQLSREYDTAAGDAQARIANKGNNFNNTINAGDSIIIKNVLKNQSVAVADNNRTNLGNSIILSYIPPNGTITLTAPKDKGQSNSLTLLAPDSNWDEVCTIAGSAISPGQAFTNAVKWGNPCSEGE